MENAEVLSEQGEKDLRQLAERLKGVFSELLDERTSKPGDFIVSKIENFFSVF